MNPNRLLTVDDESNIGEYFQEVADGLGFEVAATTSAKEFRSSFRSFSPGVIILVLCMPDADGVELLRFLAEENCEAVIIVASGTDIRVLETAKRLGASYGLQMLGALRKPFLIADLKALLWKVRKELPAICEQDLRQGIENGQLTVHYQPQVVLNGSDSWEIVSSEALVRWQHPEHGLLMPDVFIPLAEETGLISQLTEFVLASAIKQMALWKQEGLAHCVAVNISAILLDDLLLPDRISDLMEENDLAPSLLTIEITESGTMADAARTMDILTRFRIKGFGLSMDDFGTGYSSLIQLHRLPFTEMKIDKSLVIESVHNEESRKIIHSIILLAHDLDLKICAEGIETLEAMKFLLAEGCDTAQGYLISKPLQADEYVAFIRRLNQEAKAV